MFHTRTLTPPHFLAALSVQNSNLIIFRLAYKKIESFVLLPVYKRYLSMAYYLQPRCFFKQKQHNTWCDWLLHYYLHSSVELGLSSHSHNGTDCTQASKQQHISWPALSLATLLRVRVARHWISFISSLIVFCPRIIAKRFVPSRGNHSGRVDATLFHLSALICLL